METTLSYMERIAAELKDSLTHFMLNHSEIEARKPYDEVWFVGPEGDRYYADMDSVGHKMQVYLSERYTQFCSMLESLSNYQDDEVIADLAKKKELICRTIEHKLTWCESSQQALKVALEALEGQMKVLRELCKE